MRMILSILAVFAAGALLGWLAGYPFDHAGGAWRWGFNGGLIALLVALCWQVWGILKSGRVVPAVALALLAGAMLHPGPAQAGERIARQGDDSVRFLEAPCANAKVLAVILPGEVQFWQQARAIFGSQHFEACWREVRGAIFLIYEDGDRGIVPMQDVRAAGEEGS